MKPRRAVSMTEMLVILSVATVIMTLSAQMLHRIMQAHARASAVYNVERNALRLAQQFRRDVHQANDASLASADQASQLTLHLPDRRTIQYRIHAGVVTRQLPLDEGRIAYEEFRFPAETTGSFSLEESPRTVALTLETDATTLAAPNQPRRAPLHVTPVAARSVASLDRDQLLLPSAPPAEDSP